MSNYIEELFQLLGAFDKVLDIAVSKTAKADGSITVADPYPDFSRHFSNLSPNPSPRKERGVYLFPPSLVGYCWRMVGKTPHLHDFA
ncbi:hypothetical protein NIES4071_05440 [Calothrix sp. NIES-4071]|nr:hypothetical protein NIES4071_05440 [Calothrix sp. NIES-4071]BAZ54889.1 hypothetical protein NIES4105_05430 [Calothrix sp. NIES-4105]